MTWDANSVSVERRRVGAWEFASRDWQIGGDADIDALEEWLASLANKDRCIVKLGAGGTGIAGAEGAGGRDSGAPAGDLLAALETWERRSDLVVVPDSLDVDRLGLSGFARDALEELRREGRIGGGIVGGAGRVGAAVSAGGGAGMKLHRIRLQNFRGVRDREVEFAESGVTIVEGPNEVGKSSIAEALELAIEYPDSSKHRKIQSAKPEDRDEGPEVEIEISTGPYALTYQKRWIRRPTTSIEGHGAGEREPYGTGRRTTGLKRYSGRRWTMICASPFRLSRERS